MSDLIVVDHCQKGGFSAPIPLDPPKTMAGVLQIVSASNLPTEKKHGLRRDIKKACKWFGQPPDRVEADPRDIQSRFRQISAGGLRVSKKRFANVRSGVRAAMRVAGCTPTSSRGTPLTADWDRLLTQAHGKYAKMRLQRFFRYLDRLHVSPSDVTQDLADDFLPFLMRHGVVKHPRRVHREALKTWNECASKVPQWPQATFKVPFYVDKYILPECDFQPSLIQDIDRFLQQNSTTDEFDLSGRDHPLKASTIPSYRNMLLRMASLAVLAGHPITALDSLKNLVELDVVFPALKFHQSRSEKKPKALGGCMTWLLMEVSRDFVPWPTKEARDANVAALKKLAKKLSPPRGLSQVNRDRLEPLKDESNLARLFLLAQALLTPLQKVKEPTRKQALRYSLALVMMILTYCPMRIGSICRLRIDQHIRWSKPGLQGDLSLSFQRGELKNGEPQNFPLPRDCAQVMKRYLERFRPSLLTSESPFLLPSIHVDRPKWKGDVSRQLNALIFERTGFHVNPHLFRHLVHLVVLRRFPGAYAMVSRVLTHRSLDTAIRNYAYYDVEISMRAYHRLIADVQTGASTKLPATTHTIAYGFEE